MLFESSGTILYAAKISYQPDNWFGNCWGGTKIVQRHTHTHTQTDAHTQTHTHTHKHTHTKAHFMSCFLRKCRNKTKNTDSFSNRLFGIVFSMTDCHSRVPVFDSRLYPRNFSGSIGSGTGSTQRR